jgi:L-threonylcarbamoyladenylate synthase
MRVLKADDFSGKKARDVVRILERGGVICFPTDTSYGLGVDAANESAVERLFEVKGRPESRPILLLVSSIGMALAVSRPTPDFEAAASRFWPGPITLVVHAGRTLSGRVTAGTGTVGLRWPRMPLALELVELLGRPLTATSANRSNRPVVGSVSEAIEQLGEGVDVYVDAGPLRGSPVSTVLDLTKNPPVLLREGPVSREELTEFFGEVMGRSSD